MIAGPLPAKQLGLLHDLIPAAGAIAVLINPNNANAERDAATVQDAARAIGVQIVVTRAVAETDFENVFAILARERAGALLVNSDVFFTSRRDQIIALAARHALPLMSSWREFVVSGALISYGPSISAAYRQIGLYTGKILKGAKPADLPVVQPTTVPHHFMGISGAANPTVLSIARMLKCGAGLGHTRLGPVSGASR